MVEIRTEKKWMVWKRKFVNSSKEGLDEKSGGREKGRYLLNGTVAL